MLDVDDRCSKDLSFSSDLEDFIDVCRKVACGKEVQRIHIQRALGEIEKKYKLKADLQNDAHELVSTAVSHLLSANESCFIKMVAGTTCVVCGSNSTLEEHHSDIQLRLPPEVETMTSVRDLLDDYFTDEKINEMEGGQCCGRKRRWRSMRMISCPNDLFLTITRYYFSQRTVKLRTKVIIDPIINFGKYTENGEDLVYKLQGCVIHQGNTPRCGHYTFEDTQGPIPIIIDDEIISPCTNQLATTDGYILRYEKVAPAVLGPDCLPQIIMCLHSSRGLKEAMESYLPEDCLSIRQQKVIERISELDVTNTSEQGHFVSKILCDGMVQTYGEIASEITDVINSVLNYIFGNCTGVLKRAFGVSSIDVGFCIECKHTDAIEHHQLIFDPLLMMNDTNSPLLKCPGCNRLKYRRIKFITNFGQTLILNGYYKLTDLENKLISFPFFQLLANLSFDVRAVLHPPSLTFLRSETGQWLHVEGYDKVKECETIRSYEIGRPNMSAYTFVDVKELRFQKQWKEVISSHNFEMKKESAINTSALEDDMKWMRYFDQPLNVGNVHVCKEDVHRFMHAEFSDANIDAYFATLKPQHPTCYFTPSSWLSTCMNSSYVLNLASSYDWSSYNTIIIPALVHNNHWILLVVRLKERQIFYMDPMGDEINAEVVDFLVKFLNFRYVVETGRIMIENWQVINLTRTNLYPHQNDSTSCGAFVCLYGKLIVEDKICKVANSTDVRTLLLHDVIISNYECNKNLPFGIKDVICIKDLDEIVHKICKGGGFKRHADFFKNPILEKSKALDGFGASFFSKDDYYNLIKHLHARYFKTRRQVTSVEIRSIFSDAIEVNKFVQRNMFHSQWYVECVIVKEVLIEAICRRLSLSYEDTTAQCTATEYSTRDYIKTEVKLARESKHKMKLLF